MSSPTKVRHLALALLLVAGLAIGIYWHRLLTSAAQLRLDVLEQHSLTASRLAAAASTQTEALVRNLDAVLIHLRADFLANPHQFSASLQAVTEGLPTGAVPQIGVIDADGYLAASSLGMPDQKMNLGDREHFRIHAAGNYGDQLFVSAPVFGRRSGTWSIQLARPIRDKGKFRGVIVASVSPEFIARELAKFELGDRDTIALFRDDGIYLSRTPKLLEYMGKAVRVERPFIGPNAPGKGIFRDTSTHEPVARVFAWRRLGDLPLVAVAGLAEGDFFVPVETEIRRNLLRNGIGTALVALLVATIAALLLRLDSRQSQLIASEARFRSLFQILPEGILLVAGDGNVYGANDAACHILDTDRDRLSDRPYQLLYPDGRPVPPAYYPSRRASLEGRNFSQDLFAILTATGRRWISVSSRPMPTGPDGTSMGIAISIADVTRLVELEESLRVSQSVFEATTEGIMVTDANRVIISVNPAFSRITGFPAGEVIGRTPKILASGAHDLAFYQDMHKSLDCHGYWEGEVINRRPEGGLYVEWLKITAIKDGDGHITRYVALLSDITVRKRQEQEIWHQANYDALTDLPNRTLFQDRLQQAMAQALRHHCRVAVLFIDLDRFKNVNDTYGHLAGDELLRQVAERIGLCLRDEDTVARVGGDEFLVLLPNIRNSDAGHGVAEKILASLEQPFALAASTVHISASIGIALFPDHATTADTLLSLADGAMYQAKAAGRRTIRDLAARREDGDDHDRISGQSPALTPHE